MQRAGESLLRIGGSTYCLEFLPFTAQARPTAEAAGVVSSIDI